MQKYVVSLLHQKTIKHTTMKTQNLENGKIYKSSKNENNTYRFSSKLRKNEYSFTYFENGEYVCMVNLNEQQIAYLYE